MDDLMLLSQFEYIKSTLPNVIHRCMLIHISFRGNKNHVINQNEVPLHMQDGLDHVFASYDKYNKELVGTSNKHE